jgi:hypothetical protein
MLRVSTFKPQLLLTLLLLAALPTHAEIYKWTDENGKVHFGDAPINGIEAQATGIQPAPLPGTTLPSRDYPPSNSTPRYSTEPSNKEKSRERLEQRQAELARLRQACDNAKADVADAKYWRSQFETAEYRHLEDARIKAAKRREEEACKLSNFR